MLPLDDPRWHGYYGGYRSVYDASVSIRRLLDEGPTDELWEEFWMELHDQGDVDQASYAVVPWLVEFVRRSPRIDWNALALIATIDLERGERKNPSVGTELSESYLAAIRKLPAILGNHPDQEWSELVVRPAVACVALARGQRWFAKACFELDRHTAGRWFTEEFGWKMPDLKWLESFSGQTVDELLSLEGTHRIDSLVLAFEQAMDQKAARVGEDALSEEERVILAVEALEREVDNGGYAQFFVNSSREYAPFIVAALKRIGCPGIAQITQKALDAIHVHPMSEDEIEKGTWLDNDERQEVLGECDTQYFDGPENIEENLFAFIKANRTRIKP